VVNQVRVFGNGLEERPPRFNKAREEFIRQRIEYVNTLYKVGTTLSIFADSVGLTCAMQLCEQLADWDQLTRLEAQRRKGMEEWNRVFT
jgi:hypothetical protein